MFRLLNKFTKSLGEIILFIIFFILFAPVIIILLVFIAAPLFAFEFIWGLLRKEPKITVPNTNIITDRDCEVATKALADKAQQLVKDSSIKHNLTNYELTSLHSGTEKVRFSYYYDCTSIEIDNINTYEWDSENNKNLDLFFWIAIAVLRYGAYPSKSKFGRRGYWVKCDELNAWARLQKAGSSYDSILFYNKPPDSVMLSYRKNFDV